MEDIYFQNHAVTVTYNPDMQLGTAIWKGFLSSDEFREAILKCLELIENRPVVRWLGDNRDMKVIRPIDQVWFVDTVLQRLHHSALRRNAVLHSKDFFNKAAVEQIYKRTEGRGDLITKDFDSKALALAWLKEDIQLEA
jgi:hypothetical protein